MNIGYADHRTVGGASAPRPAGRRSGPGGPSHILFPIAVFLIAGIALAQPRPDATVAPPPAAAPVESPRPETSTFRFVDIFIDSGTHPLAAYQFELSATSGRFTIVGVEGGEHPAFHEAPYYDPEALTKGRIIIAAFSTGSDLPRGRTRVSRIHVRVDEGTPGYGVRLAVSASKDGAPTPGAIECTEMRPK